MIIRYSAPGPWWARGVHLLRLLPQATVVAEAAKWDLDVRVERRRQALQISVAGAGVSQQTIIPTDKGAFLSTLFQVLSTIQGAPISPWGILTGVRPGKVAFRLLQDLGQDAAREELCRTWLVCPDKARLLIAAVVNGYPLLSQRGLSIYISVPFCPSRCHYCSFVSLPLERWQGTLKTYVGRAAQELMDLLTACRQYQIPVNSIYVGGGTPTALDPGLLEELLAPATHPGCEFTVESGRPDTLTAEHLRVMKDLGVTRISVNSQYPRDETLAAIGRQHSAEQFYTALEMAAHSGIQVINSDLIVGLPGQTPEDFAQGVSRLVDSGVQNITIHALALKRGAVTQQQYLDPRIAQEIAQVAYTRLAEHDLIPYYLYRQKNIASNLENVGFAMPNTLCYYNIASIAESEPVLGVGAGAVSKLVRHSAIETLNNPHASNASLTSTSPYW